MFTLGTGVPVIVNVRMMVALIPLLLLLSVLLVIMISVTILIILIIRVMVNILALGVMNEFGRLSVLVAVPVSLYRIILSQIQCGVIRVQEQLRVVVCLWRV